MVQKILVVGSGGREHAIAAAFLRSPQVSQVWVAPGNGGTAALAGARNVAVAADDLDGLLRVAAAVDLTFVGPEVPLAAGLVDRLQQAGRVVFGPTAAAARLESSKAFSKAFMDRHGIPTAVSGSFSTVEAARTYLDAQWGPLVLKASGLAAGKGVLLPDSLEQAHRDLEGLFSGRFGDAGLEVVIEERLEGEEVSLLAFCDGRTARAMPPGRDHKRIFDGDRGPNTGGMGAFAPTPALSAEQLEVLESSVLQRTVVGMASDGIPYVGVLYAGLMLTEDGPRLLEFNCRFGDPETQVLLPLLQTDLYEVVQACVQGRLNELELVWGSGVAATVVLASQGYPGSYPTGLPIAGIEAAEALEGVSVFHAGTRHTGAGWETSGGRVLAVTGIDDTLEHALERAYAGAERIHFAGKQQRSDIGASQA